MSIEQLTSQITKLDATMSSGDINKITSDFVTIANINYTPEMVAEARKKLHMERLSTQNLAELAKVFEERKKLLSERVKILANCTKTGFKSAQERTEVIVGVAMAFNEFKKAMQEMFFGMDNNAKEANNFIASYR